MDDCDLNNCIDVLIIGRFGEGNGNNTTANRIKNYLTDQGWMCQLRESNCFPDISALNQFVTDHRVLAAIGIHAIRAGQLLRGIGVPYCLIFGGTDLNEYSSDEKCQAIISEAVGRASILVAFSQAMVDKAVQILPSIMQKQILVIPQAITTRPTMCTDRATWLASLGLPSASRLFTLVAGLRPVKDPLFLVPAFSDWHKSNRSNGAYLVIVGPQMDEAFSAVFLETVHRYDGVIYIGALNLRDMHRLMAESFAVVNSSVSEGMSTAILEAMDLGIPVIARAIPGNMALVDDGKTGLLYSKPEEFIKQCELLLGCSELREKLITDARSRVRSCHNTATERQKYVDIVNQLVHREENGNRTTVDARVGQ